MAVGVTKAVLFRPHHIVPCPVSAAPEPDRCQEAGGFALHPQTAGSSWRIHYLNSNQ